MHVGFFVLEFYILHFLIMAWRFVMELVDILGSFVFFSGAGAGAGNGGDGGDDDDDL